MIGTKDFVICKFIILFDFQVKMDDNFLISEIILQRKQLRISLIKRKDDLDLTKFRFPIITFYFI